MASFSELGIEIGQTSVAGSYGQAERPAIPGWKTFLREISADGAVGGDGSVRRTDDLISLALMAY